MRKEDLDDTTRRSILKAVGGAIATGAAGSVAGHPKAHPQEGSGAPNKGHNHDNPDIHENVGDIEQVGYHSLGGRGLDEADTPHHGGQLELRVQNGLAFVSFISSRGPTPNRGFAILDVEDYTQARSEDQLDFAEIEILSFARDDNDASAAMDIKVTDDANYAVVSREPVSALFDGANTNKNTEGSGTSAGGNSLQLWDVSDPRNPILVSEHNPWALGPHNAYIHNINGEDYVFAVGVGAFGAAKPVRGLYVFRIDRTTNQFVFVNKWAKSGNVREGGAVTGTGDGHDVTVIDDPKTGLPLVYFGMWSSPGMQVLDASDPENLREVGVFPMNRSHYVQPFPTLIDGKRLALAAQETIGVDEGSSGRMYLVDCDGLDIDGTAEEQNPELGRGEMKATDEDSAKFLDMWEWQDPISFQSYFLGPHNADVTAEGWVHLGHYHGGTMFFQIATEEIAAEDDENNIEPMTFIERGSFKSKEETPMESRLQNLKTVSPFAWSAVEKNGLTFISDINSGVYIAHHHDLEIGSDIPVDLNVDRESANSVFGAGDTVRVDVDVNADVPKGEDVQLLVRDRIPSSFDVVGGEGEVTEFGDYRTVIRSLIEGTGGERNGTFTYFAEAPPSTGSYTFGPIEYSTDGGETWQKLVQETDDYRVIGVDY